MHEKISKQAIEILKGFSEVSKILLYGSVLRGDYRTDSDIDLAIVCDDLYKSFSLDMEGIPIGLRQKIDYSLASLTTNSGIKFHVPIYWNQELENEIELYPAREPKPNILQNVSAVVYDADN